MAERRQTTLRRPSWSETDRFVPRYTMVTFRRIPYATAYARGRIQRELLEEATRGRDSLDDIDRARLDAEVVRRLEPLPSI